MAHGEPQKASGDWELRPNKRKDISKYYSFKCFDSIWHDGLFFKLIDILSLMEWRYLYNWYKSLKAIVRVNGTESKPFKVEKGTRQGSIISPHLFNIYIDDLLHELKQSPYGLQIMNNSICNADNITFLSLTITDMQMLIDTYMFHLQSKVALHIWH